MPIPVDDPGHAGADLAVKISGVRSFDFEAIQVAEERRFRYANFIPGERGVTANGDGEEDQQEGENRRANHNVSRRNSGAEPSETSRKS